jgi:hypothetical protein
MTTDGSSRTFAGNSAVWQLHANDWYFDIR